MTVEIKKPFFVHPVKSSYYSDRYENLAEATTEARKQAFRGGEDYAVFKAIAVAETPQLVNDVKVTTL